MKSRRPLTASIFTSTLTLLYSLYAAGAEQRELPQCNIAYQASQVKPRRGGGGCLQSAPACPQESMSLIQTCTHDERGGNLGEVARQHPTHSYCCRGLMATYATHTHTPGKSLLGGFMSAHNGPRSTKGEPACTGASPHTNTEGLLNNTALLPFMWPAGECVRGKVSGAA